VLLHGLLWIVRGKRQIESNQPALHGLPCCRALRFHSGEQRILAQRIILHERLPTIGELLADFTDFYFTVAAAVFDPPAFPQAGTSAHQGRPGCDSPMAQAPVSLFMCWMKKSFSPCTDSRMWTQPLNWLLAWTDCIKKSAAEVERV